MTEAEEIENDSELHHALSMAFQAPDECKMAIKFFIHDKAEPEERKEPATA